MAAEDDEFGADDPPDDEVPLPEPDAEDSFEAPFEAPGPVEGDGEAAPSPGFVASDLPDRWGVLVDLLRLSVR